MPPGNLNALNDRPEAYACAGEVELEINQNALYDYRQAAARWRRPTAA